MLYVIFTATNSEYTLHSYGVILYTWVIQYNEINILRTKGTITEINIVQDG